MKLRNGQLASVEISKLREYCLSQSHPSGRHKAKVFASALSITAAESEELKDALLLAARDGEAFLSASNEYGARYIIDLDLHRKDKAAQVRSI